MALTTITRRLRHVPSLCRRAIASAALARHQETCSETRNATQSNQEVKDHLRGLFRNIAQPVAVITSFMPSSSSSHYGHNESRTHATITSNTEGPRSAFHGATLSSFTSIAMDPFPLVTFALRIPSRMATTLNTLPTSKPVHMVVNLLAAHQSSAAIAFSRPDLHPKPFETCGVPHVLSEEGLPVLHDVVGAISCQLVGRGIPLHDVDYLAAENGFGETRGAKRVVDALKEGEITSQLFIARVVRVESVGDSERTLPLVYHQRGYTTCSFDS